MALTVHFFRFSKKHNSTALPAVGTEFSTLAELKDETDIISPQLYIMPFEKDGSLQQPYGFNYCFVPEFNRYYFIENWQWEFGRWLCTCKVDVLASYRANILGSTQYVVRSRSSYNSAVVDTVYPMINDYVMFSAELSIGAVNRPLTMATENGYYIVGIITQGGTGTSQVSANLGAVTYYLFTPAAFKALKRALFNDVSWTGIQSTTMDNDVLKAFFNPIEYIVSCKWSPFTTLNAYTVSSTTTVAFGWWTFTISSGVYIFEDFAPMFVGFGYQIPYTSVPKHPQASRGKYLYYEPYSEYDLSIAPYGIIKLPSIVAEAGFYVTEYIDMITGKALLNIYIVQQNAEEGQQTVPYVSAEAMMLIDVQLAQVRSTGDVTSRLLDTGTGLLQSFMESMPDGSIKNAVTGIAGAVRDGFSQLSTVGASGGGFAALGQFGANLNPKLNARFTKIADEGPDHFGRPLCSTVTLQTLSGFTQCANAEIAILGTDAETKEIETYLNTGFYIE